MNRLTESRFEWRSPKGVSVAVSSSSSGWSLNVYAPSMPRDEAIALGEAIAAAIDGELSEDAPPALRAIGAIR